MNYWRARVYPRKRAKGVKPVGKRRGGQFESSLFRRPGIHIAVGRRCLCSNPIEKAIDACVRGDQSIVDLHVLDVVSALTRRYTMEADGRTFKRPKLDARTLSLYDTLEDIVEMLLGRRPRAADAKFLDARTFEPDLVVAALRRLAKSIATWSEMRGRQGYLDYLRTELP